MEKRDLSSLLFQDHDERIGKLVDFAKVKEPNQRGHSPAGGSRVDRVSREGISTLIGFKQDEYAHVAREKGEQQIVEYDNE